MAYLSIAYVVFQQFMTVVNLGTFVAAMGYGLFSKEKPNDHHPWK